MTLKTQLNESMKDAMRSRDEVRLRTVRMALAAVKQVEVDKRTESSLRTAKPRSHTQFAVAT